MESAVQRRFHAARTARLQWRARRVQPQVASLHEQPCQVRIVVFEEDDPAAEALVASGLDDALDE